MSFFLILFFLPFWNWEREREYVIAVLRKGVGRNSLNVYLAFWRVPSENIFFNGLAGFCGARLEASAILLSKSSISLLHPEFGMRLAHPFMAIYVFKADILYPYFRRRKRVLLPLLDSGQSFSFFLLPLPSQAIRSDYYLFHPSEVTGYR